MDVTCLPASCWHLAGPTAFSYVVQPGCAPLSEPLGRIGSCFTCALCVCFFSLSLMCLSGPRGAMAALFHISDSAGTWAVIRASPLLMHRRPFPLCFLHEIVCQASSTDCCFLEPQKERGVLLHPSPKSPHPLG